MAGLSITQILRRSFDAAVDAIKIVPFLPSNTNVSKNFIVTTGLVTIATNAETSFLLLKNPSGSGKSLSLTKVFVGLLFNNQNGFFNIYFDPTITSNGTALTISNTNRLSSPIASTMQAFNLPTTTSFGTKILTMPIQQNSSAVQYPLEETIKLSEGKNLLISIDNAANNMPTCINAHWLET